MRLSSRSRASRPVGHSPSPLAELMCPARSTRTRSLPQAAASSAATGRPQYGSFVLATTALRTGNPRACNVTNDGASSDGNTSPVGSGGATRNPVTGTTAGLRSSHSVTAQQPRLCPTSAIPSTRGERARTDRSIAVTQSSRSGSDHDVGSMRAASAPHCSCHSVCQCVPSDPPIPGTITRPITCRLCFRSPAISRRRSRKPA